MSNRRACGGVAFVNIFQAYNVTQREIQAVFVESQNLIRFLRAAGMQAWRRSFSHGPRARRPYLRRKGARYPEALRLTMEGT